MGKIFKKSLMGFSKEQVIAYIDNLVDKQKAALEEEKEKYIQLQEENEKLVNERDNALQLAREELQSEIDAMKSEKDELMLQLEELKNENASLTASNEKLMKDKNELFESIKSIKSQLNDYIVKEKAEKEKLEELENENKILAIALQKAKNASSIDVSAYQAEIENLKLQNARLEAQLKMKVAQPVIIPEKKDEDTEEVWESLKDKINGLATDFNSLADSVKAEEDRETESKKISIKDILERVKRIGEKI